MEEKATVRAVERALDVLLCFTQETDLSMTDISSRVGLHKSTVHRLLASLESKGFVMRDSVTEKYKLGYRIWELSANMTQSDDPAALLLPEMERLRDQLGETVSLYIRDGIERIRIQAVQSNQAIRRVAPVGVRLPLYVGASSKVLLAFADPAVVELVWNDPSWTKTIDKTSFMEQLDLIRKQGYATSVEEREEGAAAVSAPIFNRGQKLAAALSISGPSNRWTLELMQRHAPLIVAAAERMGKMLS